MRSKCVPLSAIFVAVTENHLQPISDAQRRLLTEWALSRVPEQVQSAWITRPDANGGLWSAVRHPNWPGITVGFYFERNGLNTGVRIEPFRMTADATSPAVFGDVLTVRLVRQLPLEQLEREARRFAGSAAAREAFNATAVARVVGADGVVVEEIPLRDGGGSGSDLSRDAHQRLDTLVGADAVNAKSRGGRNSFGDLFYARQAARYVDALGEPNPIEAVAAQTFYAASQVRNHIAKARALGLLTRTTRGKSGGELTSKALQLLEEHGNGGNK